MCYLPPGPRCSAHAQKDYLDAARKFAECTDLNLKIILGDRLAEKLAVYDSTPKGQHDLEHAITDAEDGLEKEQLKIRLMLGKQRREQQLEAYRFAMANQNTAFQEYMNEHYDGYKKGRYQDACGIAAMYLGKKFPERGFRVEGSTQLVSEGERVLVLPEKYTATRASVTRADGNKYEGSDDVLLEILNAPLSNPLAPTEPVEKAMMDWFISTLEEDGFTSCVSVNRRTMNVVLFELEDLPTMYSIQLKVNRRVGGSAAYVGDLEEVKPLLVDTPFEQGELLKPAKVGKTILTGVPPQPNSVCTISPELYFSQRENDEGITYFELRRRHISKYFDVVVSLRAKKQVVITGADEKVFSKPEQQEETGGEVLAFPPPPARFTSESV